ncbi:DUF6678 family protein [Aquimarina sp. 2201CG14-23]|uniref:DUF6678 family protein n=1 Tax=Aquimarina mycalae TaxID=3040073 RepID=UPI002477F34C|nr:DUF6678 family protein [Aquimarina sp. 2201CG14-23]MDH7447553.1 hypothetical protein [Aquimarina sp. 2201CG14-23]
MLKSEIENGIKNMSEENKFSIRYNKKLSKEIAERTSFMNDTKWKYLFSKIKDLDCDYETFVKFLIDKKLRSFSIPDKTDFINGKYLEQYWGTCELKEIEYIFIPSQRIYERSNRNEILEPRIENQEMNKLKKCLATGKLIEHEETEKGIFIYGYSKK